MKLEVLKNKYHGLPLEDNGAYMSKEANAFARHIKAFLTGVAFENSMKLVQFNVGHYYVSGFFEKGGKYVYFLREIERFGNFVNLEKSNVLIRWAESDSDYTGGTNNYTNLSAIGRDVLRLFDFQ